MKMKAERKKIGWVLLAGLACGAIVWALSVPLTGMREPWDSPGYYYIVAVFIAGILATKLKCRPTRTAKKPGPKTVSVSTHKRSTPKPLRKKC